MCSRYFEAYVSDVTRSNHAQESGRLDQYTLEDGTYFNITRNVEYYPHEYSTTTNVEPHYHEITDIVQYGSSICFSDVG